MTYDLFPSREFIPGSSIVKTFDHLNNLHKLVVRPVHFFMRHFAFHKGQNLSSLIVNTQKLRSVVELLPFQKS